MTHILDHKHSEQLLNAINYYTDQFCTQFTISVQDYNSIWMARSKKELEWAYLEAVLRIVSSPAKGDITTLTFKATYNDAGKVIAYKVHNIPIDSKSKKALELLELAEKVIGKLDIDKASDFVKAVAIHDYIVQNSKYDEEMSRSSYTAHGVLSSGLASCLGYAETAGMLLSLAGVENRFVWAKSKMTASGTHGFIKLVLGKEWWNLDCTVDDPMPDRANVVRHDFCLVTDDVAAQRYSWDKNRYPASPKGKRNLWYEKADRVVKTQKSL